MIEPDVPADYGPATYGDAFADVYDDWYADISDVETSKENKSLWRHVMPESFKRHVSILLHRDLLSWSDLLEARAARTPPRLPE